MRYVLACLLLATPFLTGVPTRAQDHEAYEEVQPRIEDVAAVHHGVPEWKQFHEVSRELAAMLLGFYGDRHLVFKLRNTEPLYWASHLRPPDAPSAASLIAANISQSGTLYDGNLGFYLGERGLSRDGVEWGSRYVLVDGTIASGTTYRHVARSVLGSEEAHPALLHRAVVGPKDHPEVLSWTAFLRFTGDSIFAESPDSFVPRLNSERGRFATTWERSHGVPHWTGNSDHYAFRDGRYVAMARRDRRVPSWDIQFDDLDAERARALRFMEDLKHYFTSDPGPDAFERRIRRWRRARTLADDGQWGPLAERLERKHARNPAKGEAMARDLMHMLHSGHAARSPGLTREDHRRLRSVDPVHPVLVERLRDAESRSPRPRARTGRR